MLKEGVAAGFKFAVLETGSADALVGWLEKNGYAYSDEIRDWAKPYIKDGWKITALKVAKAEPGAASKAVTASKQQTKTSADRQPR